MQTLPSPLSWLELKAHPARSYRRILLDAFLAASLEDRRGVLVDLGGKAAGRHGNFNPGRFKSIKWINVNIDAESRPQIIADVCRAPLESGCAETVLCTEVLEHIKDPAPCLKEAWMLLCPGGVLILSVPFLFPIHADPFDYQRLTPQGLRFLLKDFHELELHPMGGFWGVIGMFLEIYSRGLRFRPWRAVLRCAGLGLCWLDSRRGKKANSGAFTTGCFAIAHKTDGQA